MKDVFGVKIVVGDAEQARALHEALQTLRWTPALLEQHGVPVAADDLAARVHRGEGLHGAVGPQGDRVGGDQVGVPVVGHDDRGAGAAALRTITGARVADRARATPASRRGARRCAIRSPSRIPLFGFYRDLLRWLFLSPAEPAPTFDAVDIVITD